jgi:hypothetical protein
VSRRQAVSGTVAQTKGAVQRTVLKLFHYIAKKKKKQAVFCFPSLLAVIRILYGIVLRRA